MYLYMYVYTHSKALYIGRYQNTYCEYHIQTTDTDEKFKVIVRKQVVFHHRSRRHILMNMTCFKYRDSNNYCLVFSTNLLI